MTKTLTAFRASSSACCLIVSLAAAGAGCNAPPMNSDSSMTDATSEDQRSITPMPDAAPLEDVVADGASPRDAADPPPDAAPVMEQLLTMEVPIDLAVAGGYVYFTTEIGGARVRRIPVTGGAAETMHTGTTSGPKAIDADSDGFVWTERFASTVAGAVRGCPLAGCGAAPLSYPNPSESTSEVAVSSARVAWASGSNSSVVLCVRSGNPCRVMRPANPSHYTPSSLAFDGDELFWAAAGIAVPGGMGGTPGSILRCNTAGNTCAPTAVLNDPSVGNPVRIALGPGVMYVMSTTGLFRANRDGSGLTRLAMIPTGTGNNTYDLVVDGTTVFWAVGQTLSRCDASSGCAPTVIASLGVGFTAGLALDATSVYWGTMSLARTGGIRRYAR